MTKKTSLLKGLLATASTLAVIMGGVSSAHAFTTQGGGNSNLSAGLNLTPNTPVPTGSTVIVGNANDYLTFDAPVSIIYNVNGLATKIVTTAGLTGTTSGLLGVQGILPLLETSNGVVFNLLNNTGAQNIYNITAIKIDGGTTLIVGPNIQLNGTIDANAANMGLLTVTGGGTIINGVVGGADSLHTISLANAVGTSTTFSSAVTTGTNMTVDGLGTTVFNAAVIAPTLTYNAAGTVVFNNDTMTGNADFKGQAGILDLNTSAFVGNIDSSIANAGGVSNTINVTGASSATGSLGATNAISNVNIGGANSHFTVKNTAASVVNVNTVNFADATGTFEVNSTAGAVTTNITNNLTTGTVTFSGANAITNTGAGTFGTAAAPLAALDLNATGGNSFGTAIYANVINIGGTGAKTFGALVDASALKIGGTAVTMNFNVDGSNIGAVTGGNAAVFDVAGNTTFTSTVGMDAAVQALNFTAAKTVTLDDNSQFTTIAFGANNGKLLLNKATGQTLTANITGTNEGTVQVANTLAAGDTTKITGTIGVAGGAGNLANVMNSGAGTLELAGNAYTNAVTLDGPGTIKLDPTYTLTTNAVVFTANATAASTLDLDAADNTLAGPVTVATTNTGNVVVRAPIFNLTTPLGAPGLILNAFTTAGDTVVDVANNLNNYANFTTLTDNTGTLNFSGGSQTGRVGSVLVNNPDGTVATPMARHKLVTFDVSQNTVQEFKNGVHAYTVQAVDTGNTGNAVALKFDRLTTITKLDANGTNVIFTGPAAGYDTNMAGIAIAAVTANGVFGTVNVIDSTGANKGTLSLLGGGTFNGTFGTGGANGIHAVLAGVTGTQTTFTNTVVAQQLNFQGAGNIALDNGFSNNGQPVVINLNAAAGATLEVTGTVGTVGVANSGNIEFGNANQLVILHDTAKVAGNINGAAANQGNLLSYGNTEVGNLGNMNSLLSVNLENGQLTVDGTYNTQTTVFAGDAILNLTTAQTMTTPVTVQSNNIGTITVNQPFTISAPIGANGLMLKAFNHAADTVTNVSGNNFVNFTTATNNTGTLNFSGGVQTGNIGTQAAMFKLVEAGATAAQTFDGNVFTENFTVNGANAITLNSNLTGNTFDFNNHNSTVTFNDGAILDSAVLSTGGTNGTLNFAGGTTIEQAIGSSVQNLNFQGNAKTINVYADITALNMATNANKSSQNAVNFNANNLSFGNGSTGSSLDLTNTTLNLNGNRVIISTANLTTAGTVINVGNNASGVGTGMVDNTASTNTQFNLNGVTFDLSGVSALNVRPGQTAVLLATKGLTGTLNAENLTENNFHVFNVTSDGKNVNLTSQRNGKTIQDFIGANVANNSVLGLATQLDSQLDSATGQAQILLNSLSIAPDAQTAAKIVAEHTPTSTQANVTSNMVASVAGDVHKIAQTETAARMASLNTAGKAAGAYENPMGAWAKGFYQRATEKARGDASGYKADIGGGTVGMDVGVNDNYVVGAAVSYADTNAKFKGFKTGNKLEGQSMQFNVYGMYDFCNDTFVQSTVNFGHTKVKVKNRRNGETAVGKYDVVNYGLSALGGMNYTAAENVFLTPMVGLSYSKFLTSGYSESGSSVNQIHNKKDFDKLIGTVGLRLSSVMDMGNDMKVTPEVHAFVNQDFRGKGVKDSFTIDGLGKTVELKGKAQPKTSYNLGLGVTAKSGNMEYGVSYDADLRTKYISHQGALKVRVNF